MSSPLFRLGLVVALTSVLAAPAACGGDEFTSSDGAGAAGSGASGGGDAAASAASAGGAGASPGTCASSEQVCLDVPTSWSGPVALLLGTVEPLPCGNNWPLETLEVVQAPALGGHGCSMCECADPMGGDCLSPSYSTFLDQACTSLLDDDNAGSGCHQVPNAAFGLIAEPAQSVPGTCLATGGDVDAPPPSWTAHGRACAGAAAGGACDGGICYPAPEGDARICVYQNGDHACPNGWSNQHLLHQSWDDERKCSACTCAEEADALCKGTLYGYSSVSPCSASNPSSGASTMKQDGTCNVIPGVQIKQVYWQPGARTPGACQPGGGEPEGDVVPTDPVTVCCKGG